MCSCVSITTIVNGGHRRRFYALCNADLKLPPHSSRKNELSLLWTSGSASSSPRSLRVDRASSAGVRRARDRVLCSLPTHAWCVTTKALLRNFALPGSTPGFLCHGNRHSPPKCSESIERQPRPCVGVEIKNPIADVGAC